MYGSGAAIYLATITTRLKPIPKVSLPRRVNIIYCVEVAVTTLRIVVEFPIAKELSPVPKTPMWASGLYVSHSVCSTRSEKHSGKLPLFRSSVSVNFTRLYVLKTPVGYRMRAELRHSLCQRDLG